MLFRSLLESGNTVEAMKVALRKPEEGLKKKMEDITALGKMDNIQEASLQADFTHLIWESHEETKEMLKTMTIPVGYLFGTEDPFFEDWRDNNIWAMTNTKGARSVILGGERHLMELDCPERVAQEAFVFIDESKKKY